MEELIKKALHSLYVGSFDIRDSNVSTEEAGEILLMVQTMLEKKLNHVSKINESLSATHNKSGPKFKLSEDKIAELKKLRADGVDISTLSRTNNISKATLFRYLSRN